MNFFTRVSPFFTNLIRINSNSLVSRVSTRNFHATASLNCENIENPEESNDQTPPVDPAKDRTRIIPVETSIRYLQSSAYATTYGEQPVWVPYRRNFKGQFPPRLTRKTCIRKGVIATGNPCPICRDEYLVLDHRNVNLLKQFISEYTGKVSENVKICCPFIERFFPFQVISFSKTGLCQKKHLQLLVAVARAKDNGLLKFEVPFRDFSEYYEQYQQQSKLTQQ